LDMKSSSVFVIHLIPFINCDLRGMGIVDVSPP
jgi:hypothetical protein